MVSFELSAGLKGALMKIRRGSSTEIIRIERPFYKDVLEVDWFDTHYTIVRSGIIVRNAKIYKQGEYIGSVYERIGIMTHFDVFRKAKKLFDIHEHETLFTQEFKIMKNHKAIGRLRSIGVYIPLLSNLGKGIEGEFFDLKPEEEEILVLSIIAIGV
ncbi:MAG: hypothetical protein J7K68_04710 [Candidatus Diapherotrites archaeon]|nr:hypothetical protein [Candidatus Diapherotrites archaeon]